MVRLPCGQPHDERTGNLAKPAASSGSVAKKPANRKTSAPADDNFALRSLQEELEKDRRFDASNDELLTFYEQMLLIRRFEERAGQLYGLGLIGGFCHL